MKVQEIMTANPISARPSTPIGEVAATLRREHIHHMPIVQEGRVVAFVSENEIFSYELPEEHRVLKQELESKRLNVPVSIITQDEFISVSPDLDISELIDIMLDDQLTAVPVVDPDTSALLGVVSYVELMRVVKSLID